jgi:branched-chain amino acid transport system permease protein
MNNIVSFISKKPFLLGLVGLVLLLLATAPFYFPPYTIILSTTLFMYIILTVNWVIFSGPTGYISLASAAFFGVGVYTMAILGDEFPLPVVIAIAGAASFVVALLVGALTLRLKGIFFIMFTFGLVVLIKEVLLYWELNITGTRGRFVVLESNETVFYAMLIIFVLTILVAYLINRSKLGLALRSIGENEEAAAHSGVNVTMVKVLTFGISAILVGAAGSVMATRWTYIDPYVAFNILLSFMPVLMAIFGGMGTLYGPVIGAALFAYLQEYLTTRFPYYYMLIFGAVLIAVILYLPNGIGGLVQRGWKQISGGQRAST